MSHNAYMLLREGPAQKAFCGMSPNLASRGRGGRGDGGERVQENGASLQAMNVLPAITHNQENKESVFSKKPGGRVFFMDLLHFFCEFLMKIFPDFAPNSRKE